MNFTDNRSFLVTAVLTVLLSSAGFALFHFGLIGYGTSFFVLVPLCIGYFLGQKPGWKVSSLFALVTGLVAFFYLLITAQLEGMFCVITLAPLIIALIFLGGWIGYAIRQRFRTKNNRLQLSLFPLVILLLSGTIEHYFTDRYDHGEVVSRVYLPHDRVTVFNYIKSVDTLHTVKPLLLHLGLSVPLKCILEKEVVGASRICYFKEGTIDEQVTEIRSGEILKMNVTRYGLPGRKWLKLEEAAYLFEPKGQGTLLTRITTYRTELKPRFYWRLWEEKAIEAEHTYVLDDLRRRLDGKE